MSELDHRRLGVDLFNETWTYLDRAELSPDEVEEMLGRAHASRYHWSQASAEAKHAARGEWQLSRAYVRAGRAEPAIHHAERCLEWCGRGEVEDWDVAFAHEALARAHRLAGNDAEFERYRASARELGDAIVDPEDRELFDADWATL